MAVHVLTKTLSKQDIQKNRVPEFPVLQPLKIIFMCTCDFYRYKHTYTKKKEFQSTIEKKL